MTCARNINESEPLKSWAGMYKTLEDASDTNVGDNVGSMSCPLKLSAEGKNWYNVPFWGALAMYICTESPTSVSVPDNCMIKGVSSLVVELKALADGGLFVIPVRNCTVMDGSLV